MRLVDGHSRVLHGMVFRADVKNVADQLLQKQEATALNMLDHRLHNRFIVKGGRDVVFEDRARHPIAYVQVDNDILGLRALFGVETDEGSEAKVVDMNQRLSVADRFAGSAIQFRAGVALSAGVGFKVCGGFKQNLFLVIVCAQ